MSIDKYVNDVKTAIVLGAGYIALNIVIYGGQYLVEKLVDKISPEEKKEIVVKLKKKKEILLPGTHARIDAGEFETLEGTVIRLNDASKVTEGKLFSGANIYRMKKDSTYKVEVIGNEKLGYTILGVNDAKAGETR